MIYKIPVILFACFLFPGCGIKLVHEHVLTPDESKEVLEKEIGSYRLQHADTLVDIGCGDGFWDKMIARKYPDLFLLLEDFERDEKGRVRQVWLKKYLKNSRSTPFIESHYRFVAGRADSIPLPSDTYANILCRRTLHEFDNRAKMVTEFDRILRPAGILIISETAPKHPGEIDPYCRHAYLPGDSIRSGFKSWAFLTVDSVVIKDYKMFIYRFQKHK